MKPPLETEEAFYIFMSFVKTEIRDRIGYVILDRPEKRNALNAAFVNEIKAIIRSFENKTDIRAIVLKSSGEVFCAGADLEYLQQLQKNNFEENLTDSQGLAELYKLIYSFPKPVISIVKGPAIAGGCGLATVCDLCFATPDSTFGYTEARIGFIPAIVMVFLKKKLGEAHSKKLLFTGEVYNASKVLEYGLITQIMETDSIETDVHQFVVKMISGSSSNSLKMIKEMYSELDNMSLEEAIKYASYMNATARETEDCKRGIAAFLNKEKITW